MLATAHDGTRCAVEDVVQSIKPKEAAMTKKHFIKLAAALKGAAPVPENSDPITAWRMTVNAVADVCASTNELFDRERFLVACGAQAALDQCRSCGADWLPSHKCGVR